MNTTNPNDAESASFDADAEGVVPTMALQHPVWSPHDREGLPNSDTGVIEIFDIDDLDITIPEPMLR